MKLRIGLLCAALLLIGCNHHKPPVANQAQAEAGSAAVAQDDPSTLTGLPPKEAAQATSYSSKTPYPSAQTVSFPPAGAPAAGTPSTSTDTIAAAPPQDNPPAERLPLTPRADGSIARLALNDTPPQPSTTAPASSPDSSQQDQVVVLTTSFGRIVIELDSSAAPITCENFRTLVSDGFYNHTVFHRVIPNFVIQGGDPNSIGRDKSKYGQGGPRYLLPAEIKLTHDVGAVAMARAPDSVNPQRSSNGSQFYICLQECPSLDAMYTVFGHVIKGMDVANKIADQPRDAKDDPLARIEMTAKLEPKNQALSDESSD